MARKRFRIAVFSDTHLHDLQRGIPYLQAVMARYVPDASMVLHAGDVGDPELLLAFDGYPLQVVPGNTDRGLNGLAVQKLVVCGEARIGLTHGWGARSQIERNVRESFSGRALDVIVYGHSHWPVCQRRDGILMFNPGSCVEPRSAPHPTFGILDVTGTPTGRIVDLDDLAAKYLGLSLQEKT